MEDTDWPQDWTRQIGQAVASARNARKISQHELADRCAVLGHRLSRESIALIEQGRRATISVHQVSLLGSALDVPPIELMFPAGEDVESLPARSLPAVDARAVFSGVRWLAGAVREA